jgi:hypothetical protein
MLCGNLFKNFPTSMSGSLVVARSITDGGKDAALEARPEAAADHRRGRPIISAGRFPGPM